MITVVLSRCVAGRTYWIDAELKLPPLPGTFVTIEGRTFPVCSYKQNIARCTLPVVQLGPEQGDALTDAELIQLGFTLQEST